MNNGSHNLMELHHIFKSRRVFLAVVATVIGIGCFLALYALVSLH